MRNQHQIHLNRRDRAILRSLADARYLSNQAIEWLHWPGWWARWYRVQLLLAEGVRGPHARYRVGGAVYARLRQLVQAQLIAEVDRRVIREAEFQTCPPRLYTMTDHGLRVLADDDVRPLPVAPARRSRQPDPMRQAQQIEIGRIYAALRATMELRGGNLTQWRAAPTLPTQAALAGPDAQGHGPRQQIRLKPAATCVIQRLRSEPCPYALEHPWGMTTERWQRIVTGYDAYHANPDEQDRSGDPALTVLVFTANDQQRERLMQATAQVSTAPERYRFRTVRQLHPAWIATGWLAIGHVHAVRGQGICVEARKVTLFG